MPLLAAAQQVGLSGQAATKMADPFAIPRISRFVAGAGRLADFAAATELEPTCERPLAWMAGGGPASKRPRGLPETADHDFANWCAGFAHDRGTWPRSVDFGLTSETTPRSSNARRAATAHAAKWRQAGEVR